jgi:hypothetical protein
MTTPASSKSYTELSEPLRKKLLKAAKNRAAAVELTAEEAAEVGDWIEVPLKGDSQVIAIWRESGFSAFSLFR